jgi:flagellar basal body rod protein FlgG
MSKGRLEGSIAVGIARRGPICVHRQNDFGKPRASATAMDFVTTVIAGGLRSRAESLDLAANNIANANTSAYKADREQYQVFVPEWVTPGSSEYEAWAKAPDLGKSHVNFTQGSLDRSGGPLDLALEGNGFFTVEKDSGKFLTRAGSFQLENDGQIRNRDGFKLKLLRLDGGPIDPAFRLDPQQPVNVRKDGVVIQNGVELARVSISEALDTQGLNREGNSYFSFETSNIRDKRNGFTLHQGMLERSNYDPISGSVQLINISRQFEMLQKALQLHSDMGRRVGEEIGKV